MLIELLIESLTKLTTKPHAEPDKKNPKTSNPQTNESEAPLPIQTK